MPPRYSYWTILAGGLPTAFRAADRAELEPTFNRLREKHPDAQMKWFARGKLWDSPEAARIQRPDVRGQQGSGARKPTARTLSHETGQNVRGGGAPRHTRAAPATRKPSPGEQRGRDWRPGGEHRDPRQRFKDAKKAGNVARRREKFERKQNARSETPTRRPWSHRRQQPDRDRSPKARGSTRAQDDPRRFERPEFPRRYGTEEPPPRSPRESRRDPSPGESPEPGPPPQPAEPVIQPPGPPERGRRQR